MGIWLAAINYIDRVDPIVKQPVFRPRQPMLLGLTVTHAQLLAIYFGLGLTLGLGLALDPASDGFVGGFIGLGEGEPPSAVIAERVLVIS
jgi:hypothetical protein